MLWLAVTLVGLTSLLSVPPVLAAVIGADVSASPGVIAEGGVGTVTVSVVTDTPLTPVNSTVVVQVGGSATKGIDYQIDGLKGTDITLNIDGVTGRGSASINVLALNDAVVSEGLESITFTIYRCSWTTGAAAGTCPIGASTAVSIRDAAQQALSLSATSGSGQVAAAGVPLQPFVVTVAAAGAPAVGVPIVWSLVDGQGTLSSTRTLTDAQGRASSTLTPSSGGQFVVTAQIEGTTQSVTFTSILNPLSGLAGLTGPQRSMASTLETLCPRLGAISAQRALTAGEQDLLTQCNALISTSYTDPTAAVQGIAALTPEQASVPRRLTTVITGAQIDNITTRLMALRRGVRGVSLHNLTMTMNGQSVSGSALAETLSQLGETGGGASADVPDDFERLGIFVNGNVDWGSKHGTDNEDGFGFNTQGITAGVDYRFTDSLVLGIAIGYGDTSADIDANGGDVGANAWSGDIYGTYYATDHFYLEGSATYGWGSYDQTRNIDYSLLGGSRSARADFNGTQYALMFGAGYDLITGPGILDVYGRVRYVDVNIDSYTEHGASGLDLTINDQEETSLTSILGLNYTTSISLKQVNLVPQGWLEWVHEYDNGDDPVTGAFANDPSQIPFVLATDAFDTDSFRVGLGLGMQFGQGRTAYLTYEARVGLNNYIEQTANLGVRFDF